jgi:broad specificity phosphatase PhoE
VLYLVRHGRPLVRRDAPPHEWELDPAAYDDIWALRVSGRLPARAACYSSPEPKATQTAQLLTDAQVGIVDDLRELVRDSTDWIDPFEPVVRRAFAHPDVPAYDGWETVATCRARVTRAVDGILSAHADEDVVLVGHGTAWTVLAAALTSTEPDLDRWAALGMPDVIDIDLGLRSTG